MPLEQIGLKELRAALQEAPEHLRREALTVVEDHTNQMYDEVKQFLNNVDDLHHGRRGMQSVTGNFRRNYRKSVNRKKLIGSVGLLTRRARSGVGGAPHAKLFFGGTKTQPARPGHARAEKKHRPLYLNDQRAVLGKIMRYHFGKRRR